MLHLPGVGNRDTWLSIHVQKLLQLRTDLKHNAILLYQNHMLNALFILRHTSSPLFFASRMYLLGTANPVYVLAQGEEKFLSVNCPYFDCFVIRSCNQGLAITGKVNASYSCCMSLEYSRFSFAV